MPPRHVTAPPRPGDPELPAPKGAEKDLLAAIERLREGRPINPELSERAKARKLRVNATTATIEAACARRLAYAFPRVRKALGIDVDVATEPGEAPPLEGKSLQEIVIRLRVQKAELKRERDEALSKSAAVVVRLRNMEVDVAREVRKAMRQAKRPEAPNQVAGNVHRLFPTDED